jgi:hypothetical protein
MLLALVFVFDPVTIACAAPQAVGLVCCDNHLSFSCMHRQLECVLQKSFFRSVYNKLKGQKEGKDQNIDPASKQE